MESDPSITVILSLLLLLGNAFFVAAEYGLVGARRSKIEALAKKGNRGAGRVLRALDDRPTYIAGIQIGITLFGVALGALTEPFLSPMFSVLQPQVASTLAIIIVTYPMVVAGELVPKYITLRYSERVALFLIGPLQLVMPVLKPLTWLFRHTAVMLLKPFRIDMDAKAEAISREEFAILVQTSQEEGELDESQASFLTKTLRFDTLDAEDVMVHRLDILWIERDTPRDELPAKIADIPHSRIPVCTGDIDEVVGVVYVQDILAHWDDDDFKIDRIMREPEFVPETLTLDKMVAHMTEMKTQILIVRDEYGGTSGLVTLEDLVEEIFGDMEDRLESERAPIEKTSDVRLTARADVRYDELLDFLKVDRDNGELTTETLAALVAKGLGRVPKLGDTVKLPIGTLKVENMARRRITRLAIYLDPAAGQE
ncbi:MAG: HlyC/CorC family transporter [Armatimonadetes bacterium]|nr:HlyC/CorC family transporter [Armatimonadota bacterium]